VLNKIRNKVAEQEGYDFHGEEGALHRIHLDGETLWAKRWNRSHTKNFYMPPELGGSSLSPFWHKTVELSYSLVHELFPEDTIEVRGSYDERTPQPMGKNSNFNLLGGRPVTVSLEAEGDPELCGIRDEIMNRHYAVLLNLRADSLRRGATKTEMEPVFGSWRRAINAELLTVLDSEIELDSLIMSVSPNSPDFLAELARRIRDRNPKNVMAKLFDAGVSAGHPEVNFVPGSKEKHPNPPHGTFVEFSIADRQKLANHIQRKFANDPRKRDVLMNKLRDFEIYSLVDTMFDKILIAFMRKTRGTNDPEFLGALCLVLEKFRLVIEKLGLVISPLQIEQQIINIITQSSGTNEAIATLQRDLIRPMDKVLGSSFN